jgi:hypothetical protein
VRGTKRRYFHMDLPSLIGLFLLSLPFLVIGFYLARNELSKYVYIEGYSAPKLTQYAHNKGGTYSGEFGDLAVAPFIRGESSAIARSALVKDGFNRDQSNTHSLKLAGKMDTYVATWTNVVCQMSLSVVISSDSNDKIIVSKIGEVGASCL